MMGYGPIVSGKQRPITDWQGSWAWEEFVKRCEKPRYSSFHGQYIVRHPDRPELIVARGKTPGNMVWTQP